MLFWFAKHSDKKVNWRSITFLSVRGSLAKGWRRFCEASILFFKLRSKRVENEPTIAKIYYQIVVMDIKDFIVEFRGKRKIENTEWEYASTHIRDIEMLPKISYQFLDLSKESVKTLNNIIQRWS